MAVIDVRPGSRSTRKTPSLDRATAHGTQSVLANGGPVAWMGQMMPPLRTQEVLCDLEGP